MLNCFSSDAAAAGFQITTKVKARIYNSSPLSDICAAYIFAVQHIPHLILEIRINIESVFYYVIIYL